jgi:hypothetical protein
MFPDIGRVYVAMNMPSGIASKITRIIISITIIIFKIL